MIKKSNNINNEYGHTLAELLVGLAIIGFISALVVVPVRATGQTAILDTAALKLVSDIKAPAKVAPERLALVKSQLF